MEFRFLVAFEKRCSFVIESGRLFAWCFEIRFTDYARLKSSLLVWWISSSSWSFLEFHLVPVAVSSFEAGKLFFMKEPESCTFRPENQSHLSLIVFFFAGMHMNKYKPMSLWSPAVWFPFLSKSYLIYIF